jgi:hypothetical protein
MLFISTVSVAFAVPTPQFSGLRDRLNKIPLIGDLLGDSNQEGSSLPSLKSLTNLGQGESDEGDESSFSLRDTLGAFGKIFDSSNQGGSSLPLLSSLSNLGQSDRNQEGDTLGVISQLIDSSDQDGSSLPSLSSLSSLIGSNDEEDGSSSNTRDTLGNIPIIGQLFDSSSKEGSSLPSLPSKFQILRLISKTL